MSSGLLLLAWRRPSLLRVPAVIWRHVTQAIAACVLRVVLTLIFLLVITPAGLLTRAVGRDPLRRRRSAASGWIPYPARLLDARHFERMY